MYTVLICDDEKDIVSALSIYLTNDGYRVLTAGNGAEALALVKENKEISLILLDVMMPVMDGIEALVKLRECSNVPVIMLTAKSEDYDKVQGLVSGADDYITKPFNPIELLARVKSQIRRYTQLGGNISGEGLLCAGNITLDDRSKEARRDGEPVSLTPTEFDILKLLMENRGKVYSPKEIYEQIWKDEAYGAENTVAVHIRHLREKIEINPADPRYLKAVWGHGYKFEER